MSTAKLDVTGNRWVAALPSYDFELIYKSGHLIGDCDGFSRKPHMFADSI
jgi:hypothetical protein